MLPVIDELDHKIIAVLQENARLTNAEVARMVGSTEPTVRRRIERLVACEAIRIVAVATPLQLGYNVIAIFSIQIDHSHLGDVEKAIGAMPEIRFAGVTLGSYDIIAEAWFHGNEELLTFLHERLSKIPGIQRVEPVQVAKMIKYMYDWSAR